MDVLSDLVYEAIKFDTTRQIAKCLVGLAVTNAITIFFLFFHWWAGHSEN